MTTLTSLDDVRRAIRPMVADRGGRWAYADENAVHPKSQPTIGRLRDRYTGDDVEIIRGQAYSIARRTHTLRTRFLRVVLNEPLDEDEQFALLQHFGWITHHLDVTLDLEVALCFAMHGRKSSGPAVGFEPMAVARSERIAERVSRCDVSPRQNAVRFRGAGG